MSQTYHYDRPSWHYGRPNLLEEAIQHCSRLSKSRPFLEKIGKVTEKQLENIISVAQAFLHYTDLATLQYGMWDRVKKVFKRFDLKLIKKITGLSDSPLYKAIKSLKKAGFLFVKTIWEKVLPGYFEKSDPNYKKAFKAKSAIRRLTLSFFALLGINKERLERTQSSAMRKQEEGVRKETYQEELQKTSIWSKMPFYEAKATSSAERNNISKKSIYYLSYIKYLLVSPQSLGP